jgi:hypothetical protein
LVCRPHSFAIHSFAIHSFAAPIRLLLFVEFRAVLAVEGTELVIT